MSFEIVNAYRTNKPEAHYPKLVTNSYISIFITCLTCVLPPNS